MADINTAHLTDAELAAWYGSGLHAPKAQRLIEEVRWLRARLAEVEAERDERTKDAIRAQAGWERALDRAEAAEARLAAAEARLAAAEARLAAAEARLADVVRLCDDLDGTLVADFRELVRAAARGEEPR